MQRARFAVAVVSNPDLLILDEPTAAMDVAARHSFWESMREFTDLGKTVVFATHYLDEADTFADRIVIMNDGKVIADGTPAEVKSVVSGRTLSFALTDVDPEAFAGFVGVTRIERKGARIALQTEDSDATLRALLARYPGAADIEIESRNMDDAFMALTHSTGSGQAHSTSSVQDSNQGASK
jgi:ABC-2 type transport system ATP-binding protein